jgi:hypothetical protein
VTKLIAAVRNFLNAPEKTKVISLVALNHRDPKQFIALNPTVCLMGQSFDRPDLPPFARTAVKHGLF